jgi:hypothetical protein
VTGAREKTKVAPDICVQYVMKTEHLAFDFRKIVSQTELAGIRRRVPPAPISDPNI